MLIPTPIATILTALACKAVCDLVFEDKDTRPPVQKAMDGHDTITAEVVKDMIQGAIEESKGERDED